MMDGIKSLSDRFADSSQHRIFSLQRFRPHPGVWFEQGDVDLEPGQTLQQAMAGANTNGIDIMIILLRHLLSFDYGIAELRDGQRAGTDGTTLLVAADKDMGWKAEEDWKIKQFLVRELKIQHDISFTTLLSLPSLENLFRQNA